MTTATAHKTEGSNRILTFLLGHTRFAIEISSILSITDDFGKIESSKSHHDSFLGYLYYRNKAVNTYECSTLLGRDTNRTILENTIDSLNQGEEAHISWFKELEQSINSDTAFNAKHDLWACKFGDWLQHTQNTADCTIKPLLARFEEPHAEFHKRASTLLEVASEISKGDAVKQLSEIKRGCVSELMGLFSYTKSQLQSEVHPVVLYITHDGVTPWFALVLDSMDDIASYEDHQFTQMRDPNDLSAEVHPNPVYGYVHNSEIDEKDSLVLSAARLAYLIEH
jgi:chemotaxis signal transduction protein